MRELHDTALQDLLYIGLELSDLMSRIPPELTDVIDRLKRLEKVSQDSYQNLREVLSLARSRRRGDCSLQEEVRGRIQNFTARSGIKVILELEGCEEPTQVSEHVAHQVGAIVQESLWNAWLHGKVHEVRVVMRRERGGVAVLVADSGPGFDPSRFRERSYGLRIMQERARAIKGRLQITSALDQGTLISLYFPWKSTKVGSGKEVSDGDETHGR